MTTEPEVLDPSTVANDATATSVSDECDAMADKEGITRNQATDLTPDELKDLEIARLKDELAAMKRDRAECVDLAEEHAAKLRDHEDLKSRAASAKKYLVDHGIDAGRIDIVSYGEERPACTDHNETCWQQNRRDDFRILVIGSDSIKAPQ